jgi:hypothetical protein
MRGRHSACKVWGCFFKIDAVAGYALQNGHERMTTFVNKCAFPQRATASDMGNEVQNWSSGYSLRQK